MSDNTIINNTTTGFTGQPYSTDMIIDALIITNKTGGTITLNVLISDGNNNVNVSPNNVQLLPSTSYTDEGIVIKSGNILLFTVNGSCDYYIDISQA